MRNPKLAHILPYNPPTSLTYFFYNYTTDMPAEKCRSEIEKGLKEWTDVSPFSFTEVTRSLV